MGRVELDASRESGNNIFHRHQKGEWLHQIRRFVSLCCVTSILSKKKRTYSHIIGRPELTIKPILNFHAPTNNSGDGRFKTRINTDTKIYIVLYTQVQ